MTQNSENAREAGEVASSTPERAAQVDALHQGLRERKKALMRQLISDTATLMFLERGFDEVRVSEVAAACDVSEKTIYNYFPTKESLLLDREEDSINALRQALGPEGDPVSPVDGDGGVAKERAGRVHGPYQRTRASSVFPHRRFQ